MILFLLFTSFFVPMMRPEGFSVLSLSVRSVTSDTHCFLSQVMTQSRNAYLSSSAKDLLAGLGVGDSRSDLQSQHNIQLTLQEPSQLILKASGGIHGTWQHKLAERWLDKTLGAEQLDGHNVTPRDQTIERNLLDMLTGKEWNVLLAGPDGTTAASLLWTSKKWMRLNLLRIIQYIPLSPWVDTVGLFMEEEPAHLWGVSRVHVLVKQSLPLFWEKILTNKATFKAASASG